MAQQNIVIANIATGYETDREPFNINNDAFPTLINANIFRGKIRKKRGTSLLGRLQRALQDQALGNTSGGGSFSGNILTILSLNSGAAANASLIPGSVTIVVDGTNNFTDTNPPTGILTGSGGGTGTIIYQTGAFTLTGAGATLAITADFQYNPNEPVMGLEDFDVNIVNFPSLVAFDQQYSYQFTQSDGPFYDTSFYQETGNPVIWHGDNFQQFWTTNYQSSMWATNNVPGFHFKNIDSVTPTVSPTNIKVTGHGMQTGDFVFINEIKWSGGETDVNGGTYEITRVDNDNFTIDVDTSALTYTSGGIIEYLTRSAPDVNGDGIRFYSGDPTAGQMQGWVNFAPPLSNSGLTGGKPEYLVGAKIIMPFKGRLLFWGTYTQTAAGTSVYNANQVVYSMDGTAYYALTPIVDSGTPEQTKNPGAYYQNVVGFGGFLNAPFNQEIVTVGENEDVMICQFEQQPLKLIFTGNSAFPFFYQAISSELGAQSTFSTVAMDVGMLSIGPYGLSMTTQTQAARIDLQIPDWVFNISQTDNGADRVSAIRDFRQEIVRFVYPPQSRVHDSISDIGNIFPSQTLIYNYRENNYALFNENYTTFGNFRKLSGLTWAKLGEKYETWAQWLDPWNNSSYASKYPDIIGGNQQGFVMILAQDETDEDTSQYVQDIATSSTEVLITSPNHCLNDGDWIGFRNIIGDATMEQFNFAVVQVTLPDTNSTDTFTVPSFYDSNGNQITITGTYLGKGIYIRYTNIQIQTKEFNLAWGNALQWRVGTQRFLTQSTAIGQLTVDIFNNQNQSTPINVPEANPWQIYGNVISTVPENIFFDETYNNININAAQQPQSWHRLSNSFLGSTVQLGFRMSDEQMADATINQSEIIIHAIVIEAYPSAILV